MLHSQYGMYHFVFLMRTILFIAAIVSLVVAIKYLFHVPVWGSRSPPYLVQRIIDLFISFADYAMKGELKPDEDELDKENTLLDVRDEMEMFESRISTDLRRMLQNTA